MRKMKSVRPLMLGLLTVAAVASGAAAQDQKFLPGGAVTIRMNTDWDCLDPAQCLGAGILNATYATLLSLLPSGEVIPYLATSWKATPTSIAFTIRNDATCADGTKITPTIVMKSFQRLIDMKAKNNPANFGKGPYSVAADDAAGTFTFTTGAPNSDLIYGFTDVYPGDQTGIVCPAGYADPTEKMSTKSFGAGPYTIVEAVHGDHMTLKLRPDFTWGPQGAGAKTVGIPETVTYKVIVNQATTTNLLLTGGLDTAAVEGPDVDRLMNNPALIHSTNNSQLLDFLHFNEAPGRPANDPIVRQALLTAIDPVAFRQAATNGRGEVGPSWFLPGARCFDPTTAQLAPEPSVEKARDLLLKAGWTMSGDKLVKDGKPLTLLITATQRFGAGPEYVQAQWTAIGVDAQLKILQDVTWVEDSYLNGNFDASLNQPVTPLPLYGAWKSRVSGAIPRTGTNWTRNTDEILVREGDAAVATIGEESCKHWAAFQQELWKGWHIRPLFSYRQDYFSRSFDMSLGISGRDGIGFSPIKMRRVRN